MEIIMREKLAKYSNLRDQYFGTFIRFGKRRGKEGELIRTVLLQTIITKSNHLIAEHVWFDFNRNFQMLQNLKSGDLLTFEATVKRYYKKDKENSSFLETDYKLLYPTKIFKKGKKMKYVNFKTCHCDQEDLINLSILKKQKNLQKVYMFFGSIYFNDKLNNIFCYIGSNLYYCTTTKLHSYIDHSFLKISYKVDILDILF